MTSLAMPASQEPNAATASESTDWRHRLGLLASLLQCLAALAIVLVVSRYSKMPYITPYMVVMFAFSLFDWRLRRHHPNVFRELLRTDIPLTDRMTFVGGGMLLALHFFIAIADVTHFRWTGNLPAAVHIAGLVTMTLCYSFAAWAMVLNPFFSPIVRVQEERGHRVITEGPYSIVRHPSYLGISLGSLASAFALGSYWSIVPVLLFCLLYARRATIEDRKLSKELEGFDSYSQKVRYRILPYIW